MKNRYTYLILILLITFILSGCAGKKEELNIIDDNYRNYYEIFVRSFSDSDGDGIGDLNGVDERLNYIKDLGFNGIWLMPVMPSTTYHKYDVIDYMNIDNEYGSLDDMRALIDDAHDKDIRIIIDFVMNHTSTKNAWFIEASNYLATLAEDEEPDYSKCPYAGFYHFSREKVNGSYYEVPNAKGWYYEAVFWDQMPDLNYSSEALRGEFEKIATFWVKDMKIDGFRMDATMHFEEGDTAYNCEVMNWIYEYCKSINPDFYMVSEVWASESTINDYYNSKTDSLFNFDAADAEGKIIKTAKGSYKAENFVKAMLDYEVTFKETYEDYIDAVFLTNHDMGRVCNALMSDEDALKFAGGLLMSMNGSTYVYYGEEVGMKSKGTKDENKRLPINWGDGKETLPPMDADSGIEQSFASVKEQLKDENSILNYYKHAILIRNKYPEIARGSILIDNEYTKDNIALITKSFNDENIVILYNNSKDEAVEVDLSGSNYENLKIAEYLTCDNSVINKKDGIINMPPRSILYLK